MAYTPYTPVGSNLTDLGRLLEAGEARSAATDLQRMSMMFQNAQKKADLESRRAENEADRKLKYFEVDQRKALQTRSLDMEDKRLTAEAERWFKGHELDKRQVGVQEDEVKRRYDPALLSGRAAGDIAQINAQISERNARAKAAASKANTLLPTVIQKRAEELGKRWFTSESGGREAAASEKTPKYLMDIYTALGADSELVEFDPVNRMFMPIEMRSPNQPPQTQSPSQFFGPPLPTAADLADRPFTMIPEGYPAQPAMQFPTREALDAYSNQRTNAAPVLRYNPQTGTFE